MMIDQKPDNGRSELKMRDEQVIERFKQTGALLEGHFLLSSGLHSAVYLQCAIALQETRDAIQFGAAIAAHFRDRRIETVASPAIGGIIIGYEVARQLGARFIWTERDSGTMTLRRGFTVRPGEQVLVVEDVITTGGSTRDTINALRRAFRAIFYGGEGDIKSRAAEIRALFHEIPEVGEVVDFILAPAKQKLCTARRRTSGDDEE